ncbi:MAG: DNA-directed RNA polymerase subunit omega [Planctomycetota bacterium]|nr:DNA-directed RNA polymerase subunit omega [Planctomycetota bacterium]
MDPAKEVLRIEKLSKKVGGRFKLCVLMQKRVKEIIRHHLGPVKPDANEVMRQVLDEIENDKISLVSEEEYRESLRRQLADSEKNQKRESEGKGRGGK